MMKLSHLAALALAVAAGAAHARTDVHFSIGLNAAPVYYGPPPVYYAPAPVYYAPAPVYYSRPAPVVYYDRPVIVYKKKWRGHRRPVVVVRY